MDPESGLIQVGASAPTYAPPHSNIDFDDESDAPPLPDGPPLETCRRELEAVLASLGPETS